MNISNTPNVEKKSPSAYNKETRKKWMFLTKQKTKENIQAV